jgi:Resolvase, N terminal domain
MTTPMGHVIGYARVSTTDQDLDIQIAALKAAGCDVIRFEKRSGASTGGRAELHSLLDFIRKGDTLVVTRMDRLARSIADLATIVRELEAKGAALKATERRSTPTSRLGERSCKCLACSPSSRPPSAVSARWKGSRQRRRLASTGGIRVRSSPTMSPH